MNFLSIKKRSLLAQSLFFVAQFFTATSLFADVAFTGPLTNVQTLGYGKDVFLVKDTHNEQFIVKYNTKGYLGHNSEPSIHEMLGAKIGLAAHININDVTIFPAYDTSLQSVDVYPNTTKTLHTLVPGKEVANSSMPYRIDICSALTSYENLISLTYHKNLCEIAALDIFTSNIDRHNGNLFFDAKTNQFYAIDMDWMLNDIYQISNNDKNISMSMLIKDLIYSTHRNPFGPFECQLLATRVYNFIKNIDPKKLSAKEIEALKEVKLTLQKLQAAYPPQKLYAEWMNIAQQAQYTYSSKKQQCIRYIIAYNHREITKICAYIDYILSDHSYTSYIQTLKNYTSIAWQNTALTMHTLKIIVNNYRDIKMC